ncbi:MAG: pitrilysin family protein, partial [Patescibacteria group bacterium]
KKENGLSHFLEHMLFKGTPTRPSALSVSTELDAIGAESNAFTSSEMTAYYAKSEKKHWKKLLEVVSDIYLNPSFPVADLEKERGVILQEISMYKDLPKRYVWDVLAKLMYGESSAGRAIIGSEENIKNFSRQDFLSYHRKHYVASKTIVVVAGDVTSKNVLEEVNRIFGMLPLVKKRIKEKIKEKQSASALSVENKKSDQTHMVMAFRAYDAKDKRNAQLAVLMGILGNGSSSRLFQKLREEMGACYYVHTMRDTLTDHGLAAIYTGVDKARVAEVTKAIIDECKRLTYELVSDKELEKTKNYLTSHMYMGLETTDTMAGFYLSEEIVREVVKNPQDIEKEIRAITNKDIVEIAGEIFKDENLNLAIVGNIKDSKPIKKVLTFK